ncbi:hypothetical protein PLESTB_000893000 [Pleodorina starrii]|uniref:Uncharacterized protein n=1 Tax=Pleodorina starrii TaxID=330485 RepID=A0A9W6BM10_9CHLO|nr:hypothetical protein PLESTB_000893000 [Pleodorina starrii]GLC67000.1 hypothetical protein PLESTF_000500800 [Pleodorina starrii]
MSEVDAVKETPAGSDDAIVIELDAAAQPLGSLDEEATALLKELEDSQLEVQRMLEAQRAQAQELGGMKEHLASELLQLKDDAWKLHLFAELEMLKRQLAAINSLDADLDAMEAKLDAADSGETPDDSFQDALAAARAGTNDLLSRLGGPANRARLPADGSAVGASTSGAPAADGAAATDDAGAAAEGTESKAGEGEVDGEEEAEEEDVEDVDALQDELDAELAAMMKQLQAIKAESAAVASRKEQLELELMQLMRDEADDLSLQLRDLGVGEEEAEDGEEAAAGGEAEAAVAVVEAPEAVATAVP